MKKTIKSHKSYSQQLALLKERGMIISDDEWAIKKLKQVGYYRLSGYWYRYRSLTESFPQQSQSNLRVASKPSQRNFKRDDTFVPNTTFEKVNSLYLFDCELRILLFEGIARIENYIRSVIAYTIGKEDPMGYKNKSFIDPECFKKKDKNGKIQPPLYDIYFSKLESCIKNSKDDCILWHNKNYQDIPIWVVTEVWDFGMLSRFYGLLKDKYKLIICQAIFKDNRLANSYKSNMQGALQHLNVIRNKCAHHARVWNSSINSPKFSENLLNELKIINPADVTNEKIFGTICLMWVLIKRFSDNSEWLNKIIEHIESLPDLVDDINYSEMGFTHADLDNLRKLI